MVDANLRVGDWGWFWDVCDKVEFANGISRFET
jgi:hypothetical protein